MIHVQLSGFCTYVALPYSSYFVCPHLPLCASIASWTVQDSVQTAQLCPVTVRYPNTVWYIWFCRHCQHFWLCDIPYHVLDYFCHLEYVRRFRSLSAVRHRQCHGCSSKGKKASVAWSTEMVRLSPICRSIERTMTYRAPPTDSASSDESFCYRI